MLHAIGCTYVTVSGAKGKKFKANLPWRSGVALLEDPMTADVKKIIDLETGQPVEYRDLHSYHLNPYMGIIRPS